MKRIWNAIAILLFVIILAACSQSYGANEAIERGDVVDLHGTITNAEKLDQFILNIGKHAKDKVRITRYTIEGDPIYYDFKYDGKAITYKYDNSNDKFGKSNVKSTICNNFTKKIEGSMIEYKLEECIGKNAEIGNRFSFKIEQ